MLHSKMVELTHMGVLYAQHLARRCAMYFPTAFNFPEYDQCYMFLCDFSLEPLDATPDFTLDSDTAGKIPSWEIPQGEEDGV
jgi:hypothetical protein